MAGNAQDGSRKLTKNSRRNNPKNSIRIIDMDPSIGVHKEEIANMRDEHCIYKTKEAAMKIKKEVRISGNFKPAIRDLTLISNKKESVHVPKLDRSSDLGQALFRRS